MARTGTKSGSSWRWRSWLAGTAFLTAGLAPAQDGAGDWPCWRGPQRNGISSESGWKIKGKELWRKNLGLGYSTVSLSGGRLYTLGNDKEKQLDTVYCLDPESGAEIWTYSFKSKTWNRAHGGGTLSTPTVDGDRVYVANREGRLLCFDAAKGKVHWKLDLKSKYELRLPKWLFAASPLIIGDVLYMNVGRLLALEKKSGKLIWKSDRNYGDAYSTPEYFQEGGRPLLAVFAGEGLAVLDASKGRELAFHPWKTRYDVNAATPVALGEGRIFISSGYNHGCAMLKFTGGKLEVLWESKAMRTQLSGVVFYQGYLYGFDERTLKCLDLEGNEKWSQRGLGKGALVIADGKLVLMSSKGELVIAAASPQGYQELARERILKGGVYWTTPVLAGGRIYCRNSLGELVCRDQR